jgi:hypothetical protein
VDARLAHGESLDLEVALCSLHQHVIHSLRRREPCLEIQGNGLQLQDKSSPTSWRLCRFGLVRRRWHHFGPLSRYQAWTSTRRHSFPWSALCCQWRSSQGITACENTAGTSEIVRSTRMFFIDMSQLCWTTDKVDIRTSGVPAVSAHSLIQKDEGALRLLVSSVRWCKRYSHRMTRVGCRLPAYIFAILGAYDSRRQPRR